MENPDEENFRICYPKLRKRTHSIRKMGKEDGKSRRREFSHLLSQITETITFHNKGGEGKWKIPTKRIFASATPNYGNGHIP